MLRLWGKINSNLVNLGVKILNFNLFHVKNIGKYREIFGKFKKIKEF